MLTDQGSEGIRVRLTELSWGDNVQHNPRFIYYARWHIPAYKNYSKGNIQYPIDGPFIPLVREDNYGVPLADER